MELLVKQLIARRIKFQMTLYFMGTLTRHMWIHYTDCWIVK